uniref:SCO-spondin-like n=1 Tax=Saccoglossus kowalevskii TaxID=10224 RepID=A0ABM0M5X6_SACKO|nr:PREDICTED: SCO-spondin-like [Saccoglossus kowalevskii]
MAIDNVNFVGWQECARSVKCSEQAINNYMKRYAKQHTCEEHARRHNGGSLTSCTSQYWWMVQTCLEENKCEGNGGKCIEPDECCRGTGISNRPGLQFCTEGKKCCTQKGDGLCTDCSGECIPDCLDCDLGEFISGLCPGDHYKCCRRNLANGERCHRRGGKCMQDTQAITCDGTYGGTYTPLLCPGTETCCIPNGGANCEAKGGICTNSKFKCNTLHGADWQYDNDNTLCPAPNAPFNQRCCVPVGDTMCIEAGGVCEDSSMKECCCEQDKKEFKLGMCALGNDPTCERKCCLNTGVACGDPHYTTLDGRKFSYQGTCSYVLMQDCVNVPPMFSVEAASVPGVHKGKIVTRISSVKLRLGNNIIDLVKDRVTLINGVKLRSKRSTVDSYNTTIENDGHNVKLNMEGFFTLMWNGQHRVEIIPGKNIKGKVCGLLGNNDDDPSNDFHTSLGILTKNVHQFAESWKVPYSC